MAARPHPHICEYRHEPADQPAISDRSRAMSASASSLSPDAGQEYLLPIYERLELELEAARKESSALDRARERNRRAA